MKRLLRMLFGRPRDAVWGLLNALLVVIPVYVINAGEYHQYTVAAKQGLYAFFIGVYMVRVARRITTSIRARGIMREGQAVLGGVTAAWFINLLLNIALHSIGGTPNPALTIALVSLLTMLGLLFTVFFEKNYLKS